MPSGCFEGGVMFFKKRQRVFFATMNVCWYPAWFILSMSGIVISLRWALDPISKDHPLASRWWWPMVVILTIFGGVDAYIQYRESHVLRKLHRRKKA